METLFVNENYVRRGSRRTNRELGGQAADLQPADLSCPVGNNLEQGQSVIMNLESDRGGEVEPVGVLPVVFESTEAWFQEAYQASRGLEDSPVELTTNISSISTVTTAASRYTDNTAGSKEMPKVTLWVGVVVVVAYFGLLLTSAEIVGWGTRMGWTTGTRPLIAPLGTEPVMSRMLAALSSVSAVLVWVMVVAVCASGHTIIERAARRPILPVFFDAIRDRVKLSKATVRTGWRTTALCAGTLLGAGAGAALLAAATVKPATHAQRVLFATAVALLDLWALLYILAVGTIRMYAHKVRSLAMIAGVLITTLGILACLLVFAVMRYYYAPYAMLLMHCGLLLVLSSIAWQNRNERAELRGVW